MNGGLGNSVNGESVVVSQTTNEELIPQEIVEKATDMYEAVLIQVMSGMPDGEWYAEMLEQPYGRVIIALITAVFETKMLAINILVQSILDDQERDEPVLGSKAFVKSGSEWDKE